MPRQRRKPEEKRPIESYDHRDKERLNNPPVGLVTPETDRDAGRKTYAYDPHLDPQLQWAGKAEHTSFEVPTVSLHVHERIDPRTIIEATRKRNGNGSPVQGSLFELPEENPRPAAVSCEPLCVPPVVVSSTAIAAKGRYGIAFDQSSSGVGAGTITHVQPQQRI